MSFDMFDMFDRFDRFDIESIKTSDDIKKFIEYIETH